jgi:hypothetical protein
VRDSTGKMRVCGCPGGTIWLPERPTDYISLSIALSPRVFLLANCSVAPQHPSTAPNSSVGRFVDALDGRIQNGVILLVGLLE